MRKPKTGYNFLKLNDFSIIVAAEYNESWNLIKLGDSTSGEFSNGVNKNKEYFGSGTLFVTVVDVFRNFTINPEKLKRVNLTMDEINKFKLKSGDLVLDRSSNVYGAAGYPCYFKNSDEPVVYSGFTFRFRPNKDKWNSKFLTYQLMSPHIRKLVTSISTQSANVNVNQESYKKIKVICPPLVEQEKIASILSNLDDLILCYDETIESFKKLKKDLIQILLIKGTSNEKSKKIIVIPRFVDFFVPKSWKLVKLDDLSIEIKDGPMGFALHTYDYVKNGIPILRIKNLQNLTVTKKDLRFISEKKHTELKKSQVKPFDIIISKTGVLGIIGMLPKDYGPANLNQALARITLKDKTLISFVMSFLSSKTPQQILNVIGSGRTVQAGLKLSDIKNLLIPIPSLDEQQKIQSMLKNHDFRLTNLEKKKLYFEKLKKGLMSQLLLGQIRI